MESAGRPLVDWGSPHGAERVLRWQRSARGVQWTRRPNHAESRGAPSALCAAHCVLRTQLNGQARESMNLLTHAITGLQYQIDVLKTPRSAAVLPQAPQVRTPRRARAGWFCGASSLDPAILPADLCAPTCLSILARPQLIPGTARAPDALLGSKHASGALTHRPRLERASPDAQQQSPYLDSRPSLESRPSGAVSSRSLYSPMRISVRSPHDDGTPRSPGAGGYSFHKHESRGWSREGPRSPGPPHLSHPKPSILHGDEPRTPGRPMHITIPVSDDSPSPGGAATASSPRKVHHGSTSESTTPHGDRGDKAHLREVSRLSARVVQRAMSTRRPPQRQVSSLRQPEPLTPGPLELSPSARAAEGATDRLMETLRSKKRAELKLLMPDAAAAAADQAASPSQPGSPAKGTRPAGGGASGAGARGGGASLAATVTVQALGPGAHMPFTGASPRHLYPSSSAVFVEMDMLGSGRIFGEGNRGDKARQRLCSAVADTHVELLVLEKTEVEVSLMGGEGGRPPRRGRRLARVWRGAAGAQHVRTRAFGCPRMAAVAPGRHGELPVEPGARGGQAADDGQGVPRAAGAHHALGGVQEDHGAGRLHAKARAAGAQLTQADL